jgi:hypothetical protein
LRELEREGQQGCTFPFRRAITFPLPVTPRSKPSANMGYGPPPGPPPQNGGGYPQPPVNSYNPYGNGMSADQSYVNSQPAPPAQYAPPKDEWSQQQQQPQYNAQSQYNGNGSQAYAMNQSQPYAEQAPPPQAYGSQENFGSKPNEGERFKPKKVRPPTIVNRARTLTPACDPPASRNSTTRSSSSSLSRRSSAGGRSPASRSTATRPPTVSAAVSVGATPAAG